MGPRAKRETLSHKVPRRKPRYYTDIGLSDVLWGRPLEQGETQVGLHHTWRLPHRKGIPNNTENNRRRGRRYPQIMYPGERANAPKISNTYNSTPESDQKRAEGLDRYFSGEDVHMADRHMQRCSNSHTLRDVQIKTATREHPHTCRNGPHQRGHQHVSARTCTAGGTATWCSRHVKQRGGSLKN